MKTFAILYLVSAVYVISAVRIECLDTIEPKCYVRRIVPITKKHDEVTEVTSDPYFPQNLSSVIDIYFTYALQYALMDVEYLPEKSCNHFNHLESFYVSMTQIKYISRGVFENCHKLKTIKITETNLRWIPEDTFFDLPELNTLNLETNQLKYLPGNLIAQNHKLNEFSAKSNKLEIIDFQFPHTIDRVSLMGNVCISDTPISDITTRNQLLVNNCAATLSKLENLLETVKLDADVRCTSRYFSYIKGLSVYELDNKIKDIVDEVHNWQEAELLLDHLQI